MAKKTGDQEYTVSVPKLKAGTLLIRLKGITPLIVNRFDPLLLLNPDPNAKRKPREDPADIVRRKLYDYPGGGFGFPSIGLKIAMVAAGQRFMGERRTELYGVFAIQQELLEIEATGYEVRSDRVIVGGKSKVADVRFRPAFQPWSMQVPITYITNFIDPDSLINLVRLAGLTVGIGEWRLDRKGSFGTFEIESVEGMP